MKKRLPNLNSDAEVERLFEEDLSSYLAPENLTAVTFEFEAKEKVVNLRISPRLLERIKCDAQKRKMPYQKYIRQILESAVRQ